ncbi:MAG: sigma-54-dependent Fis family transcriptional regulator [Planctomycetales bacterium]|nr:sigma-54-dependent Fis family transcriptional regulator [Planctomycetales bacterium]
MPAVLEMLLAQPQMADRPAFLQHVFPKIANPLGARYLALARADHGQWHLEGTWGKASGAIPEKLLGQVLDREEPASQDVWFAAPLQTGRGARDVLLLESGGPLASMSGAKRLATLDAWAAGLALCSAQIESRRQLERRTRRLEAILEIAAQWSQHLEMETLLQQMAETSTKLLNAERASIFLWDRVRRQLVGRPALGVEGNELRIADNSGIVGQVVQTGEPRRVDSNDRDDSINRSVDAQLGFQTRTLLCVPLRSQRGEILGAFEMINKRAGNFTDEDEAGLIELAQHAAVALENCQHYEQLLRSRQQVTAQAAQGIRLIGETPAVRQLRQSIERVAKTDLSILVLGENGTGKEVVSQMVHYLSDRRDEPLIAVNCAALTETLLESELFGHEKGAFTDAHDTRAGKFEAASGGTLFLDEIGDLSLAGQAKLLRVLEDKVVMRVGGTTPIPTDTRVIAATNQNLAEMVRQRKFREDLFFRLNVVALQMPPLRERVDDIVLLAEHFLHDFAARARRKPPQLTPAAEKRLRQHAWPGNVRELRNLMERLAYLSQGDVIDVDELSFIIAPRRDDITAVSMDMSLADATRQFQIDYIRKHIASSDNNMTDAAKNLGLHRSNLYRKMHQLGMAEGAEEI